MDEVPQTFCDSLVTVILTWTAAVILAGCQTPGDYRVDVDRKAHGIIAETQEQVLGRKGPFSIERPCDTLRRQLIEQASLPGTGPASLGSDKLPPVAHWPEDGYLSFSVSQGQTLSSLAGPLTLSLVKALEVGAGNSSDFQTKKEAVFQAALVLYLEQDSFRNSLLGQIQSLVSSDASKDSTEHGTLTRSNLIGTRQFENGMQLTTALAVDLATLFTSGGSSSFGIKGDVSLSIPLLRGSGQHIVTEPLQQAERNVVYALLEFERFKKEFAVSVGSDYLTILKQLDIVKNVQEDYRSRPDGANAWLMPAGSKKLRWINRCRMSSPPVNGGYLPRSSIKNNSILLKNYWEFRLMPISAWTWMSSNG